MFKHWHCVLALIVGFGGGLALSHCTYLFPQSAAIKCPRNLVCCCLDGCTCGDACACGPNGCCCGKVICEPVGE